MHRVGGELRDRMRRVVDPYIRERLADLEDMINRLLLTLDAGAAQTVVPHGAILLARRLGPAELLDWHARGIAGVVVEDGSATGHAAILARALGLPMLGGVRGALDAAEDEDEALLDAEEALLVLRPEQEVRQAYQRELEARSDRLARWASRRDLPSVTADGTKVTLMLNAGLALELGQLDATGAAGIGLFRTEIAMMARGAIVDVAEQTAVYARVLDAAAGRPVVFRTLDLGGDKMLPGSPQPVEENPAMGWRSLRIGLDRPAVLRKQLRALLLAGAGRPLSIMFPMVATVAEFRAARALLLAEVARVRPAPETLQIGTMLEIPALMWQLPELLREVAFRLARHQRPDAVRVRGRPRHALDRWPLRFPVPGDARPGRAVDRGGRGGGCAGLGVWRGRRPAAGGDDAGRPRHHQPVDARVRPAGGEGPAGHARPAGVPRGAGLDPAHRGGCGQPARADRRMGARARAADLSRRRCGNPKADAASTQWSARRACGPATPLASAGARFRSGLCILDARPPQGGMPTVAPCRNDVPLNLPWGSTPQCCRIASPTWRKAEP